MNEYQLGQHEARLAHIEKDVYEIKVDVKQLLALEAQRRGAWKVAATIGGGVGALLSVLVRIIWH